MTDINVEKLKEKLYEVASALFRISETCVEASKSHISETDALNKIRGHLNDAGMWSRFKVDQLIEDCMQPVVTNNFEEQAIDYLKEVLSEQHIQIFDVNGGDVSFQSCCDECSNNPKNGGSGICNCTLPYMQNPITYTVPTGDFCMANNTNDYVYMVDNVDNLKGHREELINNIEKSIERIKKYTKEDFVEDKPMDRYMKFNCPECGAPLEVWGDYPIEERPATFDSFKYEQRELIRHCEKCHLDWENEWWTENGDVGESQLRRKFWG